MLRQAVGMGVQRRVSEFAVLEHNGHGVRRPLRLRGNSAGRVVAVTGCAVSFQPCRMLARSPGSRIARLPIGRDASVTAAVSSRSGAGR